MGLEGVTSALAALGLDASFLPASPYGDSEEARCAVLLEEGVRCGFVQGEALRWVGGMRPRFQSRVLGSA